MYFLRDIVKNNLQSLFGLYAHTCVLVACKLAFLSSHASSIGNLMMQMLRNIEGHVRNFI
jgi:hypothetical protein